LRGNHDSVSAVAFGRGHHLASAGNDGTVRVWDWHAPRIPPTISRANQKPVFAVAFADDGYHLASAGSDKAVRVSECQGCSDIDDVLKLAATRLPHVFGPG
jgi:WD40 repeat protein